VITGIIFDLDDTLYDEGDFFRGGFTAVAAELSARGVASAEDVASVLERLHFEESRSEVFQKLGTTLGFPADWIPDLVRVFRSHEPKIALAPDALAVLPALRSSYRLGCVTDGWVDVQRRKISALAVESYLHAVLLTGEFGREYWKPHARPFREICKRLGSEPCNTMVVGDNPERDMAGAHNAGLRSIRLRRPGGYFASREFSQSDLRADLEISDLRLLPAVLKRF
jgi:putative hydrolase of the HAD superfamily